MYKISLFLPVYNEEKIIEPNVRIIQKELERFTQDYEVVIVDDSSTDMTSEICRKLKSDRIRIVRFENGPSRRENLAIAMKDAKYEDVGFMDIDLATDITYLEMLFFLLSKYQVVTGSRYSGIRPKRSFARLIISKIYNIFMITYFGSNFKDHQCGFKAFRKESFLKLQKKMGYDKKLNRGWFWDAELLIRAQREKMSYIEFPVEWKRGEHSSFDFKRELRMLGYVIGLRFRL